MFSELYILVACLSIGTLSSPVPYVVNGTNAVEGEIPIIVSLRNRLSHSCGASILTPWHLITAAHCTIGAKPEFLTIQYGSIILIDGIKHSSNEIQVANITVHPKFQIDNSFYNDIAILKLASPITLGKQAQPATLPPQGSPTPEGKWCTLAGWGLNRSGGYIQTNLQKVEEEIFTDKYCEEIHARTGPTDRKYNICGGVSGGGVGQCSGDSGGPLICDGLLTGLVSWSVKPCAIAPYPGVFTKVSTYVDWINEQIKTL